MIDKAAKKLVAQEGAQEAFPGVVFGHGLLAHLDGKTVYGPVAPGADEVPLSGAHYRVKLRYESRGKRIGKKPRTPARLWAVEYQPLTLSMAPLMPLSAEESAALDAERDAAKRLFQTLSWIFAPVWTVRRLPAEDGNGPIVAVDLIGLNLLVSPNAAFAAEALAEAQLQASRRHSAASNPAEPDHPTG